MKQILMMIFCMLMVSVQGEANVVASGDGWTLSDDGTLTVTGNNVRVASDNRVKKVVVSSSVTSIGAYAFSGCFGLASVEIPSSVKSIGERAFQGCGLTGELKIPSGVTSIGVAAFSGCSGLARVEIPSSVKSIGEIAFSGCSGLTGELKIPSGVTSIGHDAFSRCSGLASVEIPNSVTSIGAYAFSGCSRLARVAIPSSVTSIGSGVFSGCSGLESIEVDKDNTKYDSRGGCNAIIETEANTLVAGCKNTVIPSSVTSIGVVAFSDCSGLTGELKIPSGVTSIGGHAFSGCSGLASVEMPNSVTSIGDNAFYGCSGLASVEIPNSVKRIGEQAFSGCSGLESIEVDKDNTKYDSRGDCNAIIETETNTLVAGCKNTVIPSSVTSIGDHAFSGCSGLTSVEIPSSVTSIGYEAFYGCSGLESVEMPNSVTSIGEWAFYGCSGLANVEIPNSVTSIGRSAFSGCSGLASVEIPNSVTNIGNSAFSGCSGLKSIISWIEKPQKCNLGVSGITIYAYNGTRRQYRAAWGNKNTYIGAKSEVCLVNTDNTVIISDFASVVRIEFSDDGTSYRLVARSDGGTIASGTVESLQRISFVGDDIEPINSTAFSVVKGTVQGKTNSSIRIYTISGRLVRCSSAGSILTTDLPAGLYIITDGVNASKMIIK